MSYLHTIENLTKKRMTPLRPPTEKEAFKGSLGSAVQKIEDELKENGLEKYADTAEKLLEGYDAEVLVQLLLKTIAKDPSDQVPVKITPERPLPQGKKNFGNKGGRGGGNRGGGNRDRNRRDGNYRNKNKNYNGEGRKNDSYKKKDNRNDQKNDRNDSKPPKRRGFVIRTNQD